MVRFTPTTNADADGEAGIARCKILDSDIVIAFTRRLGDEESSVRLAAIDCAEKLAKYG